jgi:hypothetical protein
MSHAPRLRADDFSKLLIARRLRRNTCRNMVGSDPAKASRFDAMGPYTEKRGTSGEPDTIDHAAQPAY